jgi:hypothetical protein
MDETAVRILPTGDHGWAQKNVKANFIGDAKSLATVNVAAGAVEGVRHQVIFGGRTNRVHPICPQPVHQQVTHTESHWSSVDTLLEMVKHIDQHLHKNNDKNQWILLLDYAPVHISAEYRSEMKTLQSVFCGLRVSVPV